jgi:biotin synthase-related radical SAM superfamily protein
MVKKTGSGDPRPIGSLKKLEERSQRGRGAHDLLENKTLNQALEAMRAGLFEEIAKTTATEREIREEAYRMIKTTDKLKDILKVYINQGDGANKQLKQLLEN